jgi:hypothetical protein
MGESLTEAGKARLERSCGPEPDWVRFGTGAPGIERMEAFFRGYAYDPHRHDTYAFGLTLSGVQSFDYRGTRRDSLGGQAIVIHPDEVHNGRSGIESGFRYRMLYVEPRLIRQAIGEGGRTLPFISAAVSQEPRLVAAIARALRELDQPLDALAADDMVERLAQALLVLDPSAGSARSTRIDAPALERARDYLDAHAMEGVDSRRLERARRQLAQGASLANAAFACGFADQSHFTRQFRRAYGVTPGRWLALQRQIRA